MVILHKLTLAVLVSVFACISMASQAKEPDEGWFNQQFGKDDTLGALNHLTEHSAKNAARLVKKGKVYQLGMVTGKDTPAYGPRKFQMIVHQLSDGSGMSLGNTHTVGNDDTVISSVGIGSQIDGLGHIGYGHRYYNNRHASEFVAPDGLKIYGTHDLPGIVTRGVMLDMTRFYGKTPVPSGTAYTEQDIVEAARQQRVKIRRGDVVLFHSGYMTAQTGKTTLTPGEPGLGVSGAHYLAKLGVVAVGGDTWALEVLPSEDKNAAFPVHQILLAKNGVYILENMVTQPLADDKTHEFMFVLGVPKLEGAVQAIINPLAIR